MNPHTHFLQLARYNVWATRRLLDAVAQSAPPIYDMQLPPDVAAILERLDPVFTLVRGIGRRRAVIVVFDSEHEMSLHRG